MSRRMYIPIEDHNDGSSCSLFYTVRFKPASVDNWTVLNQVQPELTGSPAAYAVVIEPLEDDTVYDYEVTRNCCNGSVSTAASGFFNSND